MHDSQGGDMTVSSGGPEPSAISSGSGQKPESVPLPVAGASRARGECQCTALRRGLPYGAVMATAGASTLAGYCGLPGLVVPLLALAIVEALWLAVAGTLAHLREFALGPRPWLAIGAPSEHTGIHTVPLGLAVISAGLAGLEAGGRATGLPVVLAGAGLALTWVLALLCVGRFLQSLARHGVELAAMDGTWFLVPASLLGAATATVIVARLAPAGWTAGLAWLALAGAVLGSLGYLAVLAVAIVRVRRIGVAGVPQAPWWIAMGCAGLAAAALGSVLEMGVPWPEPLRELLAAAMCIAEILAAGLSVPVAAAGARFLSRRCRYRDKASWPPAFSSAVLALGGLATGTVLQSRVFSRIGVGAGAATLVFWLVTACWNASAPLRGWNAIAEDPSGIRPGS